MSVYLRKLSDACLTQELFHLAEIGRGLEKLVTFPHLKGHLTAYNGIIQAVKMHSVYF